MIKNNLKILQDLILEIQEFRKYLKREFKKFTDLYCRKTKTYFIFKEEKNANFNNAKKVFREFVKTIDIKEYKKLLKLEAKYYSFIDDEYGEIEFYKYRQKEENIDIYNNFTRCFYIIKKCDFDFLILEEFMDLLIEMLTYLHYDENEEKNEYLNNKAKKINKIIGIIYDEE